MERRTFLKNTTLISAGAFFYPNIILGKRSASAVQLGIIGCGSRGTAVISAMSANANVNIIAMADLFEDKLKGAHSTLNELNKKKGFAVVKAANMYSGPDAFRQLLRNREVDAVLISAPCYTHPEFLEAAVAEGRHAYCEKPVAVDVAGCKRIEACGEKAKGKQSIAIGFQIRHATAYRELIKRVYNGDIGDVVTAQLYYLSSRNVINRKPGLSDDELRIRNHFHFRSLSGGILLDQAIHMIDICNWALKSNPERALAMGSRNLPDDFGDVWNNYEVAYQYPQGVNVSMHSSQVGNVFGDVCARFIGTMGIGEAHYSGGVFINGANKWDSGIVRDESSVTPQQQAAGVFLSSLHDADANKTRSFINSIETGNLLNETHQGSTSTLTAILGRQAAEKRKEISWDEMTKSSEKIEHGLNLRQFGKGEIGSR